MSYLKKLRTLLRGIIKKFKDFIAEYNRFVDETLERDMFLQARRWRRFKCFMDWHDYRDASENGVVPLHFVEYTCSHCGSKYYI